MTSPHQFYVGQHVVCVKSGRKTLPSGWTLLEDCAEPVKGTVYTIRHLTISLVDKVLCLKLEEIPDQKSRVRSPEGKVYVASIVFVHTYFRPLQKIRVEDFMKTGVSDQLKKELQNV